MSDRTGLRAFIGYFVAAGLLNATIAALLLCRLPESRVPSLWLLLLRATVYVLGAAAAGIAGAYFYWRRYSNRSHPAPVPFAGFCLICASGWVWVPAAVLLSAQESKATAIIGIICGAILGVGLRREIPPDEVAGYPLAPTEQRQLFGATFEPVPRDVYGYVIAGCAYAAGYAQYEHAHLLAGLLSATSAFTFTWKWRQPAYGPARGMRRDATKRLAWSGALAILFTAWALLLGTAHRNAIGDAALAAGDERAQRRPSAEPTTGPGGFESLILWPFPPKKQLIPPVPAPRNYLGMEKSRPLTIRFDGAYWYFQPPDTQPGRTAHKAHGTPLTANIQSVNTFPLIMEAHQQLIGPVRLSRCGEIEVEIQNRDHLNGALSMALQVSDSQYPNRPSLYLGKKEIETSVSGLFSHETVPAFETIRFTIPEAAPIRKFDQITVMLLPEIERSTVGPRIAIEQFELFPR